MNVTFREISKLNRLHVNWNALVNSAFGIKCKNDKEDYKLSEKQLDIEIPIKNILESGGIQLAMDAADSLDFLDTCLFYADISELVLPIYLNEFSDDKMLMRYIKDTREYKLGNITVDDWIDTSDTAVKKFIEDGGWFDREGAEWLASTDNIDYIQNALYVYYEYIYEHGNGYYEGAASAAAWSILAIDYGIFASSAVAAYASIVNSRSYKDVIENTMWASITKIFIQHFC